MFDFDEKFFIDFEYTHAQVDSFLKAARKDIVVAKRYDSPEVAFQFTYNALIKIGISLIAVNKKKVKSRVGHHVIIIEALDKIIVNVDIYTTGNKMRKKRNTDLYDGGVLIPKKEADEYLKWIEDVFGKAESYLKKKLNKML